MIIVKNDTVLYVLCKTCAEEYRNSGKNLKREKTMFNGCFEDCEKCGFRKGSYVSIEKNKS